MGRDLEIDFIYGLAKDDGAVPKVYSEARF